MIRELAQCVPLRNPIRDNIYNDHEKQWTSGEPRGDPLQSLALVVLILGMSLFLATRVHVHGDVCVGFWNAFRRVSK